MKFDYTLIQFGGHVQEKVRTASGNSVVLLGITQVGTRELLLGTVVPMTSVVHPWVNTWELDGNCVLNADHNLVMRGQKRKLKGWLHIYRDGRGTFLPVKEKTPRCLACPELEIEFEEGEGL